MCIEVDDIEAAVRFVHYVYFPQANSICITSLDSTYNGNKLNIEIFIYSQLKANNVRCLSESPRIGAHGKPVMFLHPKDCGGVLTELEQA